MVYRGLVRIQQGMCAGKTHTMQGPGYDPGVYQRALQELFSATSGNEASPGADISVAMLEIYKEDVRDLLASDSTKPLDVCALGAGQLPPGAIPPHITSLGQFGVLAPLSVHERITSTQLNSKLWCEVTEQPDECLRPQDTGHL